MVTEGLAGLYELFAAILEYPTPAIYEQTALCAHQLMTGHAEAANQMAQFEKSIQTLSLAQIQELFTHTFDMQPSCYPYVGFHLFGESFKRGAFMAKLNEQYRLCAFPVEKELPDHVSVVLRFLAHDPSMSQDAFNRVLLFEGLVPAVKKMVSSFSDQSGNPYAAAVAALSLVLNGETEKELRNV